MIGILSVGGHVPRYRLSGKALGAVWGTGGGGENTNGSDRIGGASPIARPPSDATDRPLHGLRVAVHAHGTNGIKDALRAGVDTVIIPKLNEKDLPDVPAEVKEKLATLADLEPYLAALFAGARALPPGGARRRFLWLAASAPLFLLYSAEARPYAQNIGYFDRLDYVSPMMQEPAFVLAAQGDGLLVAQVAREGERVTPLPPGFDFVDAPVSGGQAGAEGIAGASTREGRGVGTRTGKTSR